MGCRQSFWTIDERRCCHTWWWRSHLLGEEAAKRRALELSCFQLSRSARARWGFRVSCWSSDPVVLSSLLRTVKSSWDHSQRRGHSVASKHVGLRRLRFQEAIADETLAHEKAHTASNPADVCTTALLGDKICELRRFAFVFLCHSEHTICADLEIWSLSQLDDRSSGVGTLWTPVLFNSRTRLMERVVFACLSFVVRLISKLHTVIMIVWAPRHAQAIG